ncbi:MAG: HD domain-containing protein [Lachnospiraceae bacterium]|nr:HD domain-containing protein [Lachnospiraceae bacterium]
MNAFYNIMLDLSLILTIVYIFMWQRHFNVHFTLIFAFIPIANMGYLLMSMARTVQDVYSSTKVLYIGGCFLTMFIMMCVLDQCKIRIVRPIRIAVFIFTIIVYSSILTVGNFPVFYRNVSIEMIDGKVLVHKVYGPMHTVFFVMVGAYFLVSLLALIYAFFKKNDVSNKTIFLLFFPELVCVLIYSTERFFDGRIELMPLAYVFSQVMYLIIVHRLCLYDVTGRTIDSIQESGETGFITFDFSMHYLGCNDAARRFIPELADIKVDSHVKKNPLLSGTALKWIEAFKKDESSDKYLYPRDNRIYLVDIDYLYDGSIRRGYSFKVTDDTKNQEYIELLNGFNSRLKEEVEEKTAHIVEMHNKLILGMATMVESRDNSTGGHIKRTSEGVRILMDEIMKENRFGLSDEFCKNIIKAAPMHDLGKIAVDDEILRKPGRFEPEEFEKMKAHAPEGAKIIHEILKDTEDLAFRELAENVAKYHHERWDGSGYPEGLKGEEIPFEARIMAVADVYDALVSKRCYKDSMSFEKADEIIMEGMGKHFDKALEPYYIKARPRLEEYYRTT